MIDNTSVAAFFPDWANIQPGEWSKFNKIIQYGNGRKDQVEIGLYREPLDGDDYAGSYTLQIFDGDNLTLPTDKSGGFLGQRA